MKILKTTRLILAILGIAFLVGGCTGNRYCDDDDMEERMGRGGCYRDSDDRPRRGGGGRGRGMGYY